MFMYAKKPYSINKKNVLNIEIITYFISHFKSYFFLSGCKKLRLNKVNIIKTRKLIVLTIVTVNRRFYWLLKFEVLKFLN